MRAFQLICLSLFLAHQSDAQVKIKAEQLFPFQEGLAVVKYQNSYGVINRTGVFVVPYNKYLFQDFGLGSLEPDEHGFVNGACVVREVKSGLFGLINQKGILIIPATYTLAYPFDKEGWARGCSQLRYRVQIRAQRKASKEATNLSYRVATRRCCFNLLNVCSM